MLVTGFSTDTVEAPERFALWEEAAARSRMPNRVLSDNSDDFRATRRALNLGELQVFAVAYPHLEIVRTAKMVRQSDPEMYVVNYLLDGEGALSLGRDGTAMQAGDLVVVDSSTPHHGHAHAVPGRVSQLVVHFPRRLLPLPEKTVRRLLAAPISGRHGMGGVFTRWLADLNARADDLTPADAPALTSITVDLLASAIARRLDLTNPRLNARPIQAIAARWGFTDPAHFSRLFRAAHGIPPRDHRNLPHAARANRQHLCAD